VKNRAAKGQRSWVGLITFCMTTAVLAALALAVLFAGATLTFAVARTLSPDEEGGTATQSGEPALRNFTGLVSDDRCGAKHVDTSKSAAECVRACTRNGGKYSLLNGDTTYALKGMEDQISVVAGERATISGTLQGNVINVSSITPLSSTQP